MTSIDKKIDFAVIFTVKNANPNGDPLNGNRPRIDTNGLGEMSDVSLKRKIRNRAMDLNQKIFVQSNDKTDDEYNDLRSRYEGVIKPGNKDVNEITKLSCETWYDVRTFGQLFAFTDKTKKKKKNENGDEETELNSVSIGIRGPVSIHPAFSIDPVSISSIQITKSVNSEGGKEKKASDTMGMKYRVDEGTYMFCGSINPQLAEKTGFSNDDAETLKVILKTLFWNDSSSARPEGSMDVKKVFWWVHNCKNGQYSAAKVHNSIKLVPKAGISDPSSFDDYDIIRNDLPGLIPEEIEPN